MAYNIIFDIEVIEKLSDVAEYLEKSWSENTAKEFIQQFDKIIQAISHNPEIGRKSYKDERIRRLLITEHNALYYEFTGKEIYLLKLIDTRQNPTKNKFD